MNFSEDSSFNRFLEGLKLSPLQQGKQRLIKVPVDANVEPVSAQELMVIDLRYRDTSSLLHYFNANVKLRKESDCDLVAKRRANSRRSLGSNLSSNKKQRDSSMSTSVPQQFSETSQTIVVEENHLRASKIIDHRLVQQTVKHYQQPQQHPDQRISAISTYDNVPNGLAEIRRHEQEEEQDFIDDEILEVVYL